MAKEGRERHLYPLFRLKDLGFQDNKNDYREGTTFAKDDEKPLLQVQDLKVHFPIRKGIFGKVVNHVKAVDGVSFDIYRGQTLGLVGESGCGKSMTSLSIMDLLPQALSVTGGSLTLNGEELTKLSKNAYRKKRGKTLISHLLDLVKI